ncbi:E3 SUMO-protein ligase pli1 [Psilocybe cubensis]|uniref:E3 SUMO-protein ligase pli1 n=2 Tax=Psilocybe cubensis TaxID=181762 RepID=A0ACB8HH37_PSICU|nr:E3 SUMO-protein ligase pli1 [Psilocybe cubensis]KAH9486987.1 E3 SUMO-protein ligase pli1 [Psilocybe cubensis]
MAATDVWMDYDAIRHGIKGNTVDRLKQILTGLNEECGTHMSKSGKKQEIIDRIIHTLESWRANNSEDKWMRAKSIIYQVRSHGSYTPSRMPSLTTTLPPVPNPHTAYDPPKPNHYTQALPGSSSSIGHYDPYAPPRRPTGLTPHPSSSATKVTGIRFKDSPFFAIDQSVSSLVECPESTSSTDRRSQSLTFTLTADQSTKMKTSSKFQLRLFCTSSVFFPGMGSFRAGNFPCPMEFPPTCEVRVNGTQITANLKGLKKKPGTAPPPDITKYSRTTGTNRVEMVYVNSQQPVQSKKYFIIIMLVEATTIDNLVNNLRGQHLKSAVEIREKMLQALSEDDDIIAGPQKMSLKCPLTFVRIVTPCRSSKCVHPQCFDATSWFTMMEQTTTWLCPVCERTLDHKDLIMDGYFDEILRQTPDSVEDVMVEADGQWHTTDNKYGSREWIAAHPPSANSSSSSSKKPPTPTHNPTCPPSNGSDQANSKGKQKEIFVLDDSDDDEDEGRVKRELSPSYASSMNLSFEGTLPPMTQPQSQSRPQSQPSTQVIDLTLDDSDEEHPIISHAQGKRRATESDLDNSADPVWKKARIDPSSRILPAPPVSSIPNSIATLPHTSLMNNHPPPSPVHYQSVFSGNVLPPPTVNGYPHYNAGRIGPANPSLQLPPLTNPTYRQPPPPNGQRWRPA